MKRWQAALGATTLLLAAACGDRVVPTDITRGVRPGVASHDATSFTGAIYTATNPTVDDPNPVTDHDLCHNASDAAPAIDCNIYMLKQFVWLSGGPVGKGLPDGTYVFAVLDPGGQQDPNDCTDANLSDIPPAPCTTTNTGAGDTWQHRVFSVSNGTISYPAAGYLDGHDFANNMIRLMPYDNTTNAGGEYVLSVCQLPDSPVDVGGPGVVPSNCKYDNFKVVNGNNCVDPTLPNCGNQVQGATVVTVVHLADHTVISAAVPLGSSVHDKATVTTDGGAAIPDHSKISFYFWKSAGCTGPPDAGPDDHTVSGASPLAEDNGQPEGPLGAGSYSYQANFTSGDPTTVSDGEGDCEPLAVSKGSLHISTDVHLDPGHSTFTSAPLGSTVHDHATVTGEVTGIPKAHAVTFALYTNGACTGTGSSVSNTGNDNGAGTGVRSASSSALAPGSYSYLATQASDDNYDVTDDTGCEPLTVSKGTLHISTDVHLNPGHSTFTSAPLGSTVHDHATVTGEVSGFPKANAVTFAFYTNGSCTGTGTSVANTGADNGANTGVRSASSAALAAGSYSYLATQASDSYYDVVDDTGCEPLTVDKGTLHITTQVHDPAHHNITNGTLVAGIAIHDFASVAGAVTGFAPQNSVTFKYYTDACVSAGTAIAAAGAEGSGVASVTRTPTGAGTVAFKASLAGDANYTVVDDTGCESLSVFPAGKTMGFWGNTNGIAAIVAAGGYSAFPAAIGRGSLIDTQLEAQKVLPNTGNACGKGNPLIFAGPGAATSTKDCLVNSGINTGTLNTASSQTLALFYNRGITWKNFGAGNITISSLGCSANLTALGLAASSTVTDVFNAAVALINGSYAGSTTQTQLGNLNVLLNCVNKEA